MSTVNACRHGVTQDFSERIVRLCVACIAEDTGIPQRHVHMVLAYTQREQERYFEALERGDLGAPPVSMKDVDYVREVLGRKGAVTFADLGLQP